MTDAVRPSSIQDLCEVLTEGQARKTVFEVRAGGSKADIGMPERKVQLLDPTAFAGVVDYEPSELVLTAGPATPLHEVEALLAASGQMLAFEPWDHGPLFGRTTGGATLGGIIAAGVSGPRRFSAGGGRDHLLGFSAVSGRGEAFKAGGKVVKNVTGYDVSKLMAGSWGQLAVFTELSLKTLPRPRATTTIAVIGLSSFAAIAAMAKVAGSPCAVAAVAHLSQTIGDLPRTLFRIEGFKQSVEARAQHAADVLGEFGKVQLLENGRADELWQAVATGEPVAGAAAIWRVNVPASRAAGLADAVERFGASWYFDWAGSLVWVGGPVTAPICELAARSDGHAALVRGPIARDESIRSRQQQPPGVASLSARLKTAFDPAGILDPHRFH